MENFAPANSFERKLAQGVLFRNGDIPHTKDQSNDNAYGNTSVHLTSSLDTFLQDPVQHPLQGNIPAHEFGDIPRFKRKRSKVNP